MSTIGKGFLFGLGFALAMTVMSVLQGVASLGLMMLLN